MRFGRLLEFFQDRPFFESREVDFLFDEPSAQIRARLSRWVKEGHLIRLRREKYLLARRYWRREPSIFFISNYLHRPSWASGAEGAPDPPAQPGKPLVE